MPDEKESTAKPGPSAEELALDMMKFIANTTGIGKTTSGAGFGGKAPKTPEEQVDVLLNLFEKCRTVVGKK